MRVVTNGSVKPGENVIVDGLQRVIPEHAGGYRPCSRLMHRGTINAATACGSAASRRPKPPETKPGEKPRRKKNGDELLPSLTA
jgi:hypothetical protein